MYSVLKFVFVTSGIRGACKTPAWRRKCSRSDYESARGTKFWKGQSCHCPYWSDEVNWDRTALRGKEINAKHASLRKYCKLSTFKRTSWLEWSFRKVSLETYITEHLMKRCLGMYSLIAAYITQNPVCYFCWYICAGEWQGLPVAIWHLSSSRCWLAVGGSSVHTYPLWDLFTSRYHLSRRTPSRYFLCKFPTLRWAFCYIR